MNKNITESCNDTKDTDISLVDILKKLWKGKWIIVVVTIIALILGTAYTFYHSISAKTSYSATATITVVPYDALNYTVNTYVEQIKSGKVIDKTIEKLGLNNTMTTGQFLSMLDVDIVPDTNMINITIWYDDPRMAQQYANAHAESYVNFVVEYLKATSKEGEVVIQAQIEDEEKKLSDQIDQIESFWENHENIDSVQREIDALKGNISNYQNALQNEQYSLSVNEQYLIQLYNMAENMGMSLPSKLELKVEPDTQGIIAVSDRDDDDKEGLLTEKILDMETMILKSRINIKYYPNLINNMQKQLNQMQKGYLHQEYEYNKLMSQYKAQKDLCGQYLQQLNQAKQLEVAAFNDIKISVVTDAVAIDSAVANSKKYILIAGIAGISTGIILILLRAYVIELFKKKELS